VVKICSVSGCKKIHDAKGYCHIHYHAWRTHGDPLGIAVHVTKLCSVDGCDLKHNAKGYCNKHYSKWKRFGDPLAVVEPMKRNKAISVRQKNWHKNNKNPMQDKKHTEKTKKLQSLAAKNRPEISQATRKKLSERPKNLTPQFLIQQEKGRKKSQKHKQNMSIAHSTPEMKTFHASILRKNRHNQQKPNKQELKIKKILTDADLIFNPEQNLNKFFKSSKESNFGMFINVPVSHIELQQKFKEVDFLIPPNKIIEHNGTYIHADPRVTSAKKKIYNTTAEAKWKLDKMILDSLEKDGYKILVIWYDDIMNDFENVTKKIQKFVKT
jgi:hypothetical protein